MDLPAAVLHCHNTQVWHETRFHPKSRLALDAHFLSSVQFHFSLIQSLICHTYFPSSSFRSSPPFFFFSSHNFILYHTSFLSFLFLSLSFLIPHHRPFFPLELDFQPSLSVS
ncbi:uncharacterized protein TrAFT101_003941 [Trichoderma asperellum]|uniref:uncharacterized protein n=1 Tax=Trichoderma asperellum TaxID=101201 RepID=UPI0033303C75|nr:hypothetical protein TrAFT101_003941 [Trichoderma asperellum]